MRNENDRRHVDQNGFQCFSVVDDSLVRVKQHGIESAFLMYAFDPRRLNEHLHAHRGAGMKRWNGQKGLPTKRCYSYVDPKTE